MAGLKLNHIYKVYPNGHKAVNDFCIDIKDKEFIVFVGPSGCGKSTTLRMIAGLEEISAGELYIDDLLVNDIEPMNRDIAMVFQNYALYPHMTVYENMAFGLRNRKIKEKQIRESVIAAAKILDIEEYLDRKPKEMSGGQCQRVALGRAIVRNPKVFLLDEPLSNLDAKLRGQMRSEITKLHKKLETTFIYVTHDQVEAMTMGTRIVVMKKGFVQQIDTPMNLYNHPKNKFVAGFIGTPQMNFFDVNMKRNNDNVVVTFDKNNNCEFSYSSISKIDSQYISGNKNVILGIRPENIFVSDKKTNFKAKVNVFEQLGAESLIYATTNLQQDIKINEDQIIVKVPANAKYDVGQIIYLELDVNNVHFFDKDTEENIFNEVPSYNRINAKINDGKVCLFNNETDCFNVLKDKNINGNVQIKIPSNAFIKGNDYSLPIIKKEYISCDNKYLLTLKNNDDYLFALIDDDVKEDIFNFSLKNEKLDIYYNNDLILNKLDDFEYIDCKLIKEKVDKEKVYYLDFKSYKYKLSNEMVQKIVRVLGKKNFSKELQLCIDRSKVIYANEGIEVIFKEELDYGNKKYQVVSFNDNDLIFIKPNNNYKKINFNEDDIGLFLKGLNIKIC